MKQTESFPWRKQILEALYEASGESSLAGREAGRNGDFTTWNHLREQEAAIRSIILQDEEEFSWWNKCVGQGLALSLFAGKYRQEAEEEAIGDAMRAACILDKVFPHDSLGLSCARDLAKDVLQRGIRPLTENESPDLHFLAVLF